VRSPSVSTTCSARATLSAISSWIAKTSSRRRVEALGPQRVAVGGADEAHVDAQPLAGAAHAALEHGADAEPLSDRANVGPSAELERGRARGHPDALEPAERGDQLLGQTVAEVLLVAPGAEVGERQHGDRRRGRRDGHGGVGAVAHGLEREEQLARRREAIVGRLREAAAHDPLEARGQRPPGGRRVVAQDGRARLRERRPREGPLAGEHLVQEDTEREDVAARLGGKAAHLLGGHVTARAQDRARRRPLEGGGAREVGAARRVEHSREAEVEDLHEAVAGHEDVVGLEVPVDDALLVGGGEAASDLRREVDGPERRQRTGGGEVIPQRLALEQLEHDVRRPAGLDVVHREDVGVADGGGGAGLRAEAPEPLGVGAQTGGQHLDRDLPREPLVAGPVHLAHPAGAERRDDDVGAEGRSRLEGHGPGDGTTPPNVRADDSCRIGTGDRSMSTPTRSPVQEVVGSLAGRLRYPWLFALLAVLFLLDLVIPDPIPLVDEVMLALLALLVGSWRTRRSVNAEAVTVSPPPADGRLTRRD
jgi:hypothetical protein